MRTGIVSSFVFLLSSVFLHLRKHSLTWAPAVQWGTGQPSSLSSEKAQVEVRPPQGTQRMRVQGDRESGSGPEWMLGRHL